MEKFNNHNRVLPAFVNNTSVIKYLNKRRYRPNNVPISRGWIAVQWMRRTPSSLGHYLAIRQRHGCAQEKWHRRTKSRHGSWTSTVVNTQMHAQIIILKRGVHPLLRMIYDVISNRPSNLKKNAQNDVRGFCVAVRHCNKTQYRKLIFTVFSTKLSWTICV